MLAQAPAALRLTFNEPVSPLVMRLIGPERRGDRAADAAAENNVGHRHAAAAAPRQPCAELARGLGRRPSGRRLVRVLDWAPASADQRGRIERYRPCARRCGRRRSQSLRCDGPGHRRGILRRSGSPGAACGRARATSVCVALARRRPDRDTAIGRLAGARCARSAAVAACASGGLAGRIGDRLRSDGAHGRNARSLPACSHWRHPYDSRARWRWLVCWALDLRCSLSGHAGTAAPRC